MVETLFDKRLRSQNCDNSKLVIDQLKILKNIHEKAKSHLIRVIKGWRD